MLTGKCTGPGTSQPGGWNSVPEDLYQGWTGSSKVRVGHTVNRRTMRRTRLRSCGTIDVAGPNDSGIRKKKQERGEKHQDVREQLEMWGVKTSMTPMVIGTSKLEERF